MSHPIFSIFGPGQNGSSTLFSSIHSDHRELQVVPLHESEEQRFNIFHLQSFESLARVLGYFPGRKHRILYPVRQDVEHQTIAAFIRYISKIENRPDDLGLPPGRHWTPEAVIAAFDRFVVLQNLPTRYAEFHRRFLKQFDIKPSQALQGTQLFHRNRADILLVPTELIYDSEPSLKSFTAPAKLTLMHVNHNSPNRKAVVDLLLPHVQETLAEDFRALREEFPAFYTAETARHNTGMWAQLCSMLHLPFHSPVHAH